MLHQYEPMLHRSLELLQTSLNFQFHFHLPVHDNTKRLFSLAQAHQQRLHFLNCCHYLSIADQALLKSLAPKHLHHLVDTDHHHDRQISLRRVQSYLNNY